MNLTNNSRVESRVKIVDQCLVKVSDGSSAVVKSLIILAATKRQLWVILEVQHGNQLLAY